MTAYDKYVTIKLGRDCPSCGSRLAFDLDLTASVSEMEVERAGYFGFSDQPEPYAPEMPNVSGFSPFFEALDSQGRVAGQTNGTMLFFGVLPKSLPLDPDHKRKRAA